MAYRAVVMELTYTLRRGVSTPVPDREDDEGSGDRGETECENQVSRGDLHAKKWGSPLAIVVRKVPMLCTM